MTTRESRRRRNREQIRFALVVLIPLGFLVFLGMVAMCNPAAP